MYNLARWFLVDVISCMNEGNMKNYEPPEVTEYGEVTAITEGSGTNKVGSKEDELDKDPLTGTVF